MALMKASDLTLRPARISLATFKAILQSHGSPALPEAAAIWTILTVSGVDPSFALGQFQAESIMGKAGWATKTHSWGNMVMDPFNMPPDQATYSPGNGRTYASYPNWTEGAKGYVSTVVRYAATADPRYGSGFSDTIDKATARWTAKKLTDPNHLSYVQVIVNLVNNEIEYVPGLYIEAGDTMIDVSQSGATTALRYPVANGTPLYRGPDGDVLKLASFASSPAICRFVGPAGATAKYEDTTWAWGVIIVNVSGLGEREVYIKNPDKAKVTKPSLLTRLTLATPIRSHKRSMVKGLLVEHDIP